MPKDQGEACSLLSFPDFSHGWPDRLVASMSLPCPGATAASTYRLNRLHMLSLQSGATLQISELCKGTRSIQMAAATTQDKRWPSVKPTKGSEGGHNTQKEAWRRSDPTGYQALQHLC